MTPRYRTGQVRIIAGEWRRRRISFPDLPGLRPSPDRVRETLFNWLQPVIDGAACLDLFAGSGIFALESLSRGAAQVVMVERHPAIAAHLETQLEDLGVTADRARVVHRDAMIYLRGPVQPFDIVFVDPPFDSALQSAACTLLDEAGWVRPGGYIYLESRWTREPPPLPPRWQLLHRSRAGHVGFCLARAAQ